MGGKKVIVIGGGASGFFAAIACAQHDEHAEVIIVEKFEKYLSKVRVSGGGRCNVTHACFDNQKLIKYYPRGAKFLKKCFAVFSTQDTVEWFEKRGVPLKVEEDNRMFPQSDNSKSIVDCLVKEALVFGVKIITGIHIQELEKKQDGWQLKMRGGELLKADYVVVTTGGNSKSDDYNWLRNLGLAIAKPIPSLFTFKVDNFKLNGLQGIAVKHAVVRIEGTKMQQDGPLLITHWGFSGPSVLKLSSWAAKELHESNYKFSIHINFIPEMSEDKLRDALLQLKKTSPKKTISSTSSFGLSKRLWERLVLIAGIDEQLKFGDLSLRSINKLIEELIRGNYQINGKSTFKEEFVTCGGVDLEEINPDTMESYKNPALFFAGEVLDIDALTGGFNFQAAWTTGFIAGSSIAKR